MEYKVSEGEYRFLELLWDRMPVGSTELVGLCNSEFGWKKSTTYTVIKRLIEKDVVVNENAMVRAVMTREEFKRMEADSLLDNKFGGNVPGFVAAFLKDRKITQDEAKELYKMINDASK